MMIITLTIVLDTAKSRVCMEGRQLCDAEPTLKKKVYERDNCLGDTAT
jgi:hypothetical protein